MSIQKSEVETPEYGVGSFSLSVGRGLVLMSLGVGVRHPYTSTAVSFMCRFSLRPEPVLQKQKMRFYNGGKGQIMLQK